MKLQSDAITPRQTGKVWEKITSGGKENNTLSMGETGEKRKQQQKIIIYKQAGDAYVKVSGSKGGN